MTGETVVAAGNEIARLKGQFLASLNHEIRTPLSGIVGMTDLLLETGLSDEQREYVTSARLCAETLLEVFNGMLEYSALLSGTILLDNCEYLIQEVVESAASGYLLKARAKGLDLTWMLDPGTPEVLMGDAPRLRKILSHLISNAVKFTGAGRVAVHVSVEGASLRICVSDTGCGISREELQNVFDSFRRMEKGLARSHPGMGLGLAIVNRLVHMMQGRVEIQSEIGKGSEFTVVLPLCARESASVVPAITRTVSSILLVEDNRVSRTIVRRLLTPRGYQVDCAESGGEALESANRSLYTLVMMDLQLPDMSGFEVVRRLREIPGYEDVPILAFTANATDEYRRLCRESGMQGFLGKPVQASELLSVLSGSVQ